MADIDKILNVKPKIKFETIIPEQYWCYLNVFNGNEINQLTPIRGKKIIHEIELLEEKKNGFLGSAIQYIERRIFGIEDVTVRTQD